MRRIKTYSTKENAKDMTEEASDADWITTLLVCILPAMLGLNGIHRFMTGHVGTGILMLLTLGGCGIWTLYDLIMIATEKFVDSDGKVVMKS